MSVSHPPDSAVPQAAPTADEVAALEREGWVTARPPRMVEVLSRVVGFPGLVSRNRDLVWQTVRRELESRFKGTLLGWAWPLVFPMFMFVIYYFIFTKLLAMKFPSLPEEQKAAMGVFMFVGVLVWTSFAESLARGCNVIVENGNLIKKLAFPSEVLPLNVVLVNLITMLFGVAVFVLACFATPLWLSPGWMLAWIPVLLLLHALFAFGFTLLVATLQVFLRDTQQVVNIGVTVWMFLTPVFWAPEIIQNDFFTENMGVIRLNPTYHLVYVWREVLMSGEPSLIFTYDFGASLTTLAVWSVAMFAVGYSFFILCQRRFADEV